MLCASVCKGSWKENRSDVIWIDNVHAQERGSVPSELVVLSATRRTY